MIIFLKFIFQKRTTTNEDESIQIKWNKIVTIECVGGMKGRRALRKFEKIFA